MQKLDVYNVISARITDITQQQHPFFGSKKWSQHPPLIKCMEWMYGKKYTLIHRVMIIINDGFSHEYGVLFLELCAI